ncbi:MAG: helix-turn-helix domain-containing protein [Alteromonadaceae bacterium]|nr:helix-turn-helix domain-containing protein [Alteromonadaceae bacterium]
MTKQHANATTTPEMRAFIHESDLPTAVLARLLKISESTVRKWRQRESLKDGSHVPKQLNTTLSEAQEYVVVELRTRLLLSLDELLAVCKNFINANVSRAGLQRCLKRHGVSRLADLQDTGEVSDADNPNLSQTSSSAPIKVKLEDTQNNHILLSDVSPQAMHEVLNRTSNLSIDEVVQVKVTQLPQFSKNNNEKENKRRLLVANDPASGWVYVDIYEGDEKEAASRYMSYVLTKAPFHIRRILAGNYTEFLSRFRLLNDTVDGVEITDSENATRSSLENKS